VGRRLHTEEVVRRNAPVVVALWALGVAQPLLDLFGKNPEFFVVNDLSRLEIVLFGLVAVLGGPVVLVVLQLGAFGAAPRLGRAVHTVEVALLATAFGFVLLGQLDVEDSAIVVGTAAFLGALVAYVERSSGRARSALRYLALTPVVFLVAFFGFSSTAELLLGEGGEAVEPGVVGDPAPIVLLSMDEFPVASLLRPDGSINATRFPNFARLAERATWYQDATSVAPLTQVSVPAILTGRFPEEGALPTARDHPASVFTLLGAAYDQHVSEQMTDVCPEDICPDDTGLFDLDRLRTAISDAGVVYAQVAMPPDVREHLPAIDRSWGGFIDDANAEDGDAGAAALENGQSASDPAAVTAGGADPSCPSSELWCGGPRLSELADSIEAEAGGDRPDLWLAHVTVPHVPWIRSATGRQYAPRVLQIPGTTLDGEWDPAEPYLIRQSFQRHLLQIGYVDRLLGRVMDAMEAAGVWDDALFVLTADHGVSFQPGTPLRAPTPETLHEIYNVPLFVKLPGQEDGGAVADNALTIDILPTIVDALDVDTDWEFDGESLLADDHRPDKPVVYAGTRSVVPPGIEGVLAVARRDQSYVPDARGWRGVAAVGPYGDLVGQPVATLDTTGVGAVRWSLDEAATLSDWDPDGGRLAPLLVHGRLDPGAMATPTDALLALNGVVAGTVGGLEPDGDTLGFSALLVEDLLEPGDNEVQLLLPVSAGARSFLAVPLGP